MNTYCNKDDDRRLRELFHEKLTDMPGDPEFTRKVMNRLPSRRNRLRWLIGALYALAALIGCGLWVYTGREAMDAHALTWWSALLCISVATVIAYIGVSLSTSASD